MRKKIFTIALISLLIIGIALIIIGYACIGTDIVGWLKSRYAMWFYVAMGIFFIVWLILEVKDRISRL